VTAALAAVPTTPARPAVSCVMIFLDAERFIDESIRSVIDQTRQDWELILVDDGSSDSSSDVARRWAGADARIRYVDHEGHANRGMSASRNRGIAEARGPLVAFLDSDDVWTPSALAHRLRVLGANPTADAMVGGTWRWYSWTGDAEAVPLDERMRLPPTLPTLQVVEPPDAFIGVYAAPDVWYVPAMCSIIIRRDRLLALGGLTDEFVGMYEDQVLYTKVLLGLRVVFDERALSLYRQHDGSACAVAIRVGEWHPVVRSAARDRFLAWLADDLPSRCVDPAVDRVLTRNLAAGAPAGATADESTRPSSSSASGDTASVHHDASWLGALATRTRRRGGMLMRRMDWWLGRRPDVVWLMDHWTRDHVSGWPGSSVTVAEVRPRQWRIPARGLRELRTLVDETPTVVAMVPARRRRAMRSRRSWITALTLAGDARRELPGSVVTIEPFGNGRVWRALAAGVHAGAIPRVELDRHDGQAPIMWALTIERPAGAPPAARRDAADPGRLVVDSVTGTID
jgi:glycosyltransferase involved in cell wall biosynthesis